MDGVHPDRTEQAVKQFFTEEMGPRRCRTLQVVCMDMWAAYAKLVREHAPRAQILFDLGIRQIRLLTNNTKKVVGLDGYGLRDHSWGPRKWTGPKWWRWISCWVDERNGFAGFVSRVGDNRENLWRCSAERRVK